MGWKRKAQAFLSIPSKPKAPAPGLSPVLGVSHKPPGGHGVPEGGLCLGAHCRPLTVSLAQSYTAVSTVVTELSCREDWFLDVPLEMEVWLLMEGLW